MGLLPGVEQITVLNIQALRGLVEESARLGLGRNIAVAFARRGIEQEPDSLRRLLSDLYESMEESPVPEREAEHLQGVLGLDLVGELVHASPSSLRRYAAGVRQVPTDVANRLHVLALLVGDLAGSYTDAGIRRWFGRPRPQLGDRSPKDVLSGAWDPESPEPRKVRELAEALTALPAT